jgi:hypothetical protein
MGLLDTALNIGTLGMWDELTPEQPAAPDYTGAAEATAAGNLAMAREAVEANRVNQYTPWGTSTWTRPDAPGGTWSQTTSLTPGQQNLFNLGEQTDTRMGELGLAGLNATGDMFSTPLDFSGMGEFGNYGDARAKVMDSMLQRVNQQTAQDKDAARSALIASGIPPGSEAFNREMELIDRKQTDARQQAEIAATQQAGQMQQQDVDRRRQMITEALTQRQNPLNELNAFRTGTQIQAPQFAPVPQQQTTLGPDYMGATTAQGNWDLAGWNAENAFNQQLIGGAMDMGAAYLGR